MSYSKNSVFLPLCYTDNILSLKNKTYEIPQPGVKLNVQHCSEHTIDLDNQLQAISVCNTMCLWRLEYSPVRSSTEKNADKQSSNVTDS